jgi:hypothetical protein
MYRTLNATKLLETSDKLHRRIVNRFPDAGLGEVAGELTATVREGVKRAAQISSPNIPLRIGLFLLMVLIGVFVVLSLMQKEQGTALGRAWQLLDATRGAAVYLVVMVVFFWSLETRFKRRKALAAIHELRSLAHVIDMHQLPKDPEQFTDREETIDVGDRKMDPEAMAHYLHFCTELLAIVSKIGQLYVQDFPDGTSLAAVDQVETLAANLSQKIWQKLMIIDRIRSEASPAAG